MNVTAELRQMAACLARSVEHLSGERREEAEERLLQTVNLVASRHSYERRAVAKPKPIPPPVADKMADLMMNGLREDHVIDGRTWKAFEPLSIQAAARFLGIKVKRARANFVEDRVRFAA